MLSYEDVYDRWERSKSFGDPRDINQFSRDMNEVTGTNDFDLGANAGGWTKFSAAANREFFHPVARGLGLEAAGQAVGGLFGERGREIGGHVGLGLPRMVAQTIPLVAGEIASGGALTPALLAGAAATGGLFGAETYAETQSPTAAAISGVTAAALPAAGRFGGEVGLRAFGPEIERKVVEKGGQYLTEAFPKAAGLGPKLQYRAAQLGGSQAAMLGTLEASQFAQAKALGQPFDPLSPELIATQIPFTMLDIGRAAFTRLPSAGEVKGVQPKMPRVERPYTPPAGEPGEVANLAEMLDKVTGIAKDQTATPEEKSDAFSKVMGSVVERAPVTQPKPQDQVILIGHVKQPAGTDNLKMYVTQQKYFDDLPENANVWVNKPSTVRMMNNPDGSVTVIAPRSSISKNVQYPLGPGDFAALRQKGQAGLEKAPPPTGEGISPENDILSLRQKFNETVRNRTMFESLVAAEPKDPDLAVQHWQNAIEKMTPEYLKPGYKSPWYDADEERVMKENNIDPTTVPTVEPQVITPAPNVGESVDFMVGNRQVRGTFERELSDGTMEIRTPENMVHQVVPEDLIVPKTPVQEVKTAAQKVETTQQELSAVMDKSESVPTTIEDIAKTIFGPPERPEELHAEHLRTANPAELRPAIKLPDGKIYTGHEGDLHYELYPTDEMYQDLAQDSVHGFVDKNGKFLNGEEGHKAQTQARLEIAQKEGASRAQATEKVRLQTQTPQVDRTKQQVNIAKDDLKRSVREAKVPETKAAFLRDDSGKVIKTTTPEEAQTLLEEYKASHPEDPVNYRVTKLRGKYQIRTYPQEVSLELGRKIEAEAVQAAEVEEPETAITGKGVYVPEVEPAARAEEGILVETDPNEGAVPTTEPEARPDLSFNDYVSQLDMASNNPTRVMRSGGFDDVPDTILALRQFRAALTGPMREGKTDLKSINDALKKAGIIQFDNEALMRDTFKMVRDGLDDFQLRYRSKFLDSNIPHDPEVAAATGIQAQNGLARFLEWYADSKAGTVEGELVAGLRKYSDFNHVDLSFSPEGSFYQSSRQTNGRPKINLKRLPSSMDDALGDWGSEVVEEILHDTTDGIHYRTDPAAMQFKASLTRIMRVMENSNNIPSAVRNIVKKAKAENWYDKWSQGKVRAREAEGYRPAGNRFLYSMATFDPVSNKLGGKHTIPRSGLVDETTFGKIGGMEGVPLNKHEIALYKLLVPEAFKRGQVDVPMLDQELQKKAPVVEVRKLPVSEYAEDPEYTEAYTNLNRLAHDFETRFPGYRVSLGTLLREDPSIPGTGGRRMFPVFTSAQRAEYESLPEELKAAYRQVQNAQRVVTAIEDRYQGEAEMGGGGGYEEIAPKHDLPGYVEGLVRLPTTVGKRPSFEEFWAKNYPELGEADAWDKYSHMSLEFDRRSEAAGVLHRGSHYGSEDINTLSTFRAYEENMGNLRRAMTGKPEYEKILKQFEGLPDDEKVLNIIELQGDWAQHLREMSEAFKKGIVSFSGQDRKGGMNFIFRTQGENPRSFQMHSTLLEQLGWKDTGLVGDALTNDVAQFAREHVNEIMAQQPQHPLLPVYNELALKAAVQHAKDIGAKWIIVPDAETAMMTEGHDYVGEPRPPNPNIEHTRAQYPWWVMDDANKIYSVHNSEGDAQQSLGRNYVNPPTGRLRVVPNTRANLELAREANRNWVKPPPPTEASIPFARGMRTNYDVVAQSAMKKLTGQEGVRVNVGTHKNAKAGSYSQLDADRGEISQEQVGQPRPLGGSKIFKESTGEPKSSVTGSIYPISHLPGEFTLTQRMRAGTPYEGAPFDIHQAYKDAGGTPYWWETFYSLLNEHELTAGIHGSPTFRDLLIRTNMPNTPRTVLQFFANVWAKVFGYSTRVENAFAQFLQSYDTYLSGPRMPRGYNGMSYLRDSALALGTGQRQMASRLDGMDGMYSHASFGPSIAAFEREMNDGLLPATTVAGPLNEDLKTALVSGTAADVKSVAENLLIDAIPQHQELWLRLRDDFKTVRNLHAEAKKGNVPAELGLFQEGLNSPELSKKLNILKNELDRHGAAIARWNMMDSLGNSDGMQRLWSGSLKGDAPIKPSEQIGNEDIAHEVLNINPTEYITAERRRLAETGETTIGFVDRNAKFASFVAQEQPAFKPIYQVVLETQGNAHSRMSQMEVVRNSDPTTKAWSKDVARANKRVRETAGLSEIVSDMLRRANILEREGKPVTMGDDEMQAALRRASDAPRSGLFGKKTSDRQDVITAFNSESARHQYRVDKVIPEHLDMTNKGITAFGIIGREIGMPAQKAIELSERLYTALNQIRDPAQNVIGAEGLKYVASQMQPSTFMKVLEQTNGLINDTQKFKEVIQRNRYYTSEQRYGKFHLVMSKEGTAYRQGFQTEKAARARARELQTDGWVLEDIIPKDQANVRGYIASDDQIIAAQRELDQQALNRLESLISDLPAERQDMIRPLVQRAADYEASAAAFAPVPTQASPRRRFIPGRETIDMLANADEDTRRTVNWMRHRETRVLSATHFLEPDMLANRGLKDYSRKFVDNNLSADNPIARRFNEAAFYWYLAGNFGNDVLESLQSLSTGMASVIAETGSVGDAVKYVTGASAKIAKRYTTGKWGDKESEWFINFLSSRGHLGLPTWGDLYDPTTQSYFDVNAPKSSVGKALGAIKSGLRGYKTLFIRNNDMVAGLASFQLARDLGMSLEDSARFAEGVKIRGLYTGGKAQRPVGPFSIKNKAVPQLMFSLKTYITGFFSQLNHYWKVGFANAPGDFTPAQRVGARKAFMYMLGAQATLAGALGLPGVGQALALTKQMTGLDIKGWTRKNLAAMFGEDQEDYGGMLTGLALHGILSQAAPFDISGRQVTDIPFTGVSSWKGFDLSNIMPVPFSMASDFIQGIGSLAKGQDPSKAFPIALRGPVQLLHGQGDLRNSRGQLLYQLTPSDRFWKALGLEPRHVAGAKETAATIKAMNDAEEQRKTSSVDSVADLYVRGDRTAAQRRMVDIARNNPTYDMSNFARSVAAEVEKRTFPYDWKREVNPAVDIVGLANDQPSRELERLQLRRKVSGDLGFYNRPSMRRSIQAERVDEMRNADPYMTRSLALQRLLTARQLRRRNTYALPEVYQ